MRVRVPGACKKNHYNDILTINYYYENKEIAGDSHSNVCHLSVTNLTSVCDRIEALAQTINKHLAFNGNESELKSSFNMSFGDKVAACIQHFM